MRCSTFSDVKTIDDIIGRENMVVEKLRETLANVPLEIWISIEGLKIGMKKVDIVEE